MKILLPLIVFCTLAGTSSAAEVPCTVCHAQTTPNAAHDAADVPCTACHTGGEAHLRLPSAATIESFDGASGTKACTACHTDTHVPAADKHARAGVTCTSCHDIHTETPQDPSASCAGCHADVSTAFDMHERHRAGNRPGQCTTCHDPHETAREPDCADCHTETAGPFVYEHASSRLEGCGACHAPHGSPNRHLLALQDTGSLCLTCHNSMPQFHVGFAPNAPSRFDSLTQCTNCHVEIHGSNLDRHFLK